MPLAIDEMILMSLRRITRAIDQYSHKLAIEYKLTAPQLICLKSIKEHPKITASQLKKEVSLSHPTLTGILDRLELRGYIERKRNGKDKRKVHIKLTESGSIVFENSPMPLHEIFRKNLLRLSIGEQLKINDILEKIVDMMEAEEIDAVPLLASGPVTATPGETMDFLTMDKLSQDGGGKDSPDDQTEGDQD